MYRAIASRLAITIKEPPDQATERLLKSLYCLIFMSLQHRQYRRLHSMLSPKQRDR
jgi:hypothetical protein